MKIIILAEAKADLRWFKHYYTRVFPEGRKNADQQYHSFLRLLKTTPTIGEAVEDMADVREYPIRNIPFSVIYRVRSEHIELLRIFDQRSEFSNERRK